MSTSRDRPHRPALDADTFTTRNLIHHLATSPMITDPICPICCIPYGETHDNSNTEHPVSINIPSCNHVFGNHCLHVLVYGQYRYRNKCPLCRTVWFRTREDELDVAWIEEAVLQDREHPTQRVMRRLGDTSVGRDEFPGGLRELFAGLITEDELGDVSRRLLDVGQANDDQGSEGEVRRSASVGGAREGDATVSSSRPTSRWRRLQQGAQRLEEPRSNWPPDSYNGDAFARFNRVTPNVATEDDATAARGFELIEELNQYSESNRYPSSRSDTRPGHSPPASDGSETSSRRRRRRPGPTGGRPFLN